MKSTGNKKPLAILADEGVLNVNKLQEYQHVKYNSYH